MPSNVGVVNKAKQWRLSQKTLYLVHLWIKSKLSLLPSLVLCSALLSDMSQIDGCQQGRVQSHCCIQLIWEGARMVEFSHGLTVGSEEKRGSARRTTLALSSSTPCVQSQSKRMHIDTAGSVTGPAGSASSFCAADWAPHEEWETSPPSTRTRLQSGGGFSLGWTRFSLVPQKVLPRICLPMILAKFG